MKISVVLEALTGSFETDMSRASKTAQKRMAEIQKTAKQAGAVIGAALAAGATAAAYAIKSAIDRADELSKGAQKIGVTTEALSRLGFAAELADVELQTLQSGLGKLVKLQSAAAQGADAAVATFRAFGIEIKNADGSLRDTQSVLYDFAEVFKNLPDGPEKTALALRVFGKSGAELIPLLNAGSQGLADMAAEADRLGITISTQTGKDAEEFNDTLTRVKTAAMGVATQVGIALLPQLQDLADSLKDGAGQASDFAGFAQGMATVFAFVGRVAAAVALSVKALTSTVIALVLGAQAAYKLQQGDLAGAKKAFGDAKRELQEADKLRFDALKRLAGVQAPKAPSAAGAAATDPAAAAAAKAQAQALLASEQEAQRKQREAEAKRAAAKAEAEARKAAAEAAREQEQRERDLAEAVEKAEQASADFKRELEDLEAQQAGPLAVAELEHKRRTEEITKLWSQGTSPAAADLERALNALNAEYKDETDAIKESLDPGEQRLKQLREEIRILGLKTQAERDAAQFRAENKDATDAQAAEYADLLRQRDAIDQQIAANDQLKASFEDNFAAVLTGSKSASDAFKDFADSIIAQIARIIAQQAATALFGDGTGGGLLGGLFGGSGGGLLSGFFASGTNFAPGGLAVVGEQGPEVVSLPRGSKVTPNHRAFGGKSVSVVNNITVPGNTSRETAQQIASKVSQAVSFAGRAA